MSIRLVRESSDTPNVANRDDTCFVRHAYGVDGYVPNFGNGMGFAVPTTTSFRIQGGRVNIQGWEIDITNHTIPINRESFTGTRYDFVYVELNLLLEFAEIKVVRDGEQVFPLSLGDDLTYNPNGIARLPLYRIPVNSSGVVSADAIEVLAHPIQRSGPRFDQAEARMDSLEYRLELLGFKEGTFESVSPDTSVPQRMTRQGNYVIGQVNAGTISHSDLGDLREYTFEGSIFYGQLIGKVPEYMAPLQDTSQIYLMTIDSGNLTQTVGGILYMTKDGSCYLGHVIQPHMTITECWIQFGYEALPLGL
jgi:hypothetical protein